MKRRSVTWLPLGVALAFALLALITMFGLLNGPIKSLVEGKLSESFGARVTIESLDGNPFFEFSLSRVEISDSSRVIFACGEAIISYHPIGLLWGNIVVDSLRFVSPRLRLMTRESSDGFRLGGRQIPQIDLKNIVVQQGILTLGDEDAPIVVDHLHLELGFRNTGGEAALQVRRLQTIVLDPPIEIANLTGLALSREDVLVFQDVQLSSPHSRLVVNGEVVGLSDPLFRFDVSVDSLSLTEVGKVTGVRLPPSTVWLSGRVEGTRDAYDAAFDWVIGGAAGDVRMRVSGAGHGQPEHIVEIRGHEVDLAILTGVPLRGDFLLNAEGAGLSFSSAIGQARASVSNGSLYGIPIDSLTAKLGYREGTVRGGLLLDGDAGTFRGTIRIDPEQRFWMTGRLSGVDLAQADGPTSQIDGNLRVSGLDGATRIQLDLDSVLIHDHDAGTITADLSQSTSALILDSLRWKGPRNQFGVRGRGDLWRRPDDLFSLTFEGVINPAVTMGIEDRTLQPVVFTSRVWSEPLTFGATRELMQLSADLAGLFGLDSLGIGATADGGRVVLDRFEASGEDAFLTVAGEMILQSAFDLQSTYTSGSLEGIPQGLRAGATGTGIRLTGGVVGPWESPEIFAKLQAERVYVAGGSFEALSVDSNIPVHGEGGVSIQAEAASWGGRTLHGFYADVGSVGDEISFLLGNREGSENRVSIWGGASVVDESLSVRVDSARIQLQDEYVVNRGPISLSHSPTSGLVVHQLYLVGPSGELEAASQDEGGAISIRVHQFDLAPWAFLVGMDDRIEGKLSGRVSIEGGISNLTTLATLEVVDGRIDSFRAETIYSEVSYRGGQAFGKIGARVSTGNVHIEGSAGLDTNDPDREIDLRFVSEAFPLSAVNGFWPQVAEIDGELSGQVWMTGPARAVETIGDLVVSSGQVMIPSLNRGVTGVAVEVDVSPHALTLVRFEGVGQTGSLSAGGTIELLGLNLDRVSEDPIFGALDLELSALGLDASGTPEMQAVIDGTVGLTGTLKDPVLVGKLTLEKAEIRLLSMLEAPPDPESIWLTIPFFKNLQCNLQVSANRQLWVRDDLINVELSGDIDVLRDQGGAADRSSDELGFRFFGAMSSLRGTYRFQNRDFRIEEGELSFLGAREVNPDVNITAQSRIPVFIPQGGDGETDREDLNVTVLVSGSFTQPEITLSDDEGSPQADLLSYVLFGRAPDQLIAAEQNILGEQSAGLVLGFAAYELQSRIADRLNLDMVQVEMGSGSSISRVRVGKYVSDRLFVTYEDQIGQGREFTVEYELLPRFSIESRIHEDPDRQVAPSLRVTWSKDW